MNQSFTFHKTALLAVCGALLQLSAQAQVTNDTGIVEMTGQISPTTCILNMADTAGGTNTATNKTMDLGNTKSGSGTITAGSLFGQAKTVVFSLSSTSNATAPCTAGAGNTGWNVILGFAPGSVTTIGTKTYVKNQTTTGGTNAVVALSDATVGTTTTQLTLKETMGYTGTTVTATNQAFGKTITLQAQLAHATAAAATAGAFNATIPLLVLYK